MKEIRLRKLLPLVEHMKDRCLELYQPVHELSIDEWMVKSKAQSHMIQYMKNKPTKWGFKLWVIADPSGFTCDFNTSIQAKMSVVVVGFHTMPLHSW